MDRIYVGIIMDIGIPIIYMKKILYPNAIDTYIIQYLRMLVAGYVHNLQADLFPKENNSRKV